MYRLEGYKNPFEEYHNAFDIPTVQDAEWEAYEAGADAILEVINNYLVPYGIYFGDDGIVHSVGRQYKKVKKDLYLVIPEE